MVGTRKQEKAAKNAEEDQREGEEIEAEEEEEDSYEDTEEVQFDEEKQEEEHRETGDLLWDQLSRLPFFEAASMEEKRSMYFAEARRREEREDERRREELEEARRRENQEFELKRLEIQSRSESASNASDQTAAAYRTKVKLPDWDPNSTIDAYLDVCESLLEGAEVPENRWVGHLVPKLPHEARTVYKCLDREDRNDYEILKRELLTHYAVSAAVYRRNFFTYEKSEKQTYRQFLRKIEDQLRMWTHCVTKSGDQPQWEQLLMIYRLEQELTDEVRVYMQTQTPKNANEFVALADDFVQTIKVSRREQKKTPGTEHGKTDKETGKFGNHHHRKGDTQGSGSSNAESSTTDRVPAKFIDSSKFCTFCKMIGHERHYCYRNPDSSTYKKPPQNSNDGAPAPTSSNDPSSKGISNLCVTLQEERDGELHPAFQRYAGKAILGSAEGKVITYLRDTGTTICLMDRSVVPPDYCAPKGEVTVDGFNGVRTTYPTAEIHVKIPGRYNGTMTVALVEGQPTCGVSLLIGNDLAAIAPALDMPRCIVTRSTSKQRDLPTDDSLFGSLFESSEVESKEERQMESADPLTEVSEVTEARSMQSPCSDANESAGGEEAVTLPQPWNLASGVIRVLQENDPTLTPLWGMVRRAELRHTEDDCCYFTHPVTGLLMHRGPKKKVNRSEGDDCGAQIVVPRGWRQRLLHWVQVDLTAGHLPEKKAPDRLQTSHS